MIDLITSAFNSLQSDAGSYSQGVQIWMKLMAVSFLVSLVFVYPKTNARWIGLAFIVNILGLILGKILFSELSRTVIGTCVHLAFWPAILFAIWFPDSRPKFQWLGETIYSRLYLIWICWASLLLSISVLLDLRTFLGFII